MLCSYFSYTFILYIFLIIYEISWNCVLHNLFHYFLHTYNLIFVYPFYINTFTSVGQLKTWCSYFRTCCCISKYLYLCKLFLLHSNLSTTLSQVYNWIDSKIQRFIHNKYMTYQIELKLSDKNPIWTHMNS